MPCQQIVCDFPTCVKITGRFRIQIGIKLASWNQIGIKSMPIHNTVQKIVKNLHYLIW
jgi:hypothetical protein